MLSSPLRDRFGVLITFEPYQPEELARVVTRSAGILDIAIDAASGLEIGRRSRGTPRVANRLLRRIRDFAEVCGEGEITPQVTQEALRLLEVDALGLDKEDRRFLTIIAELFAGGPVGLDTVAASMGEESRTIEDVIEPFLMQIGFLARTPRGRILTPSAYRYLDIPLPSRTLLD